METISNYSLMDTRKNVNHKGTPKKLQSLLVHEGQEQTAIDTNMASIKQ